jgi:hypothetical protein
MDISGGCYQIDHVDHGSVAGYKHQKSDLDSVRALDVSRLDLLGHEFTDEVVFSLLTALVD